jgi:hypothetical protein
MKKMRHQLSRRGKDFLLAAAGIFVFSWEKERIPDGEILGYVFGFICSSNVTVIIYCKSHCSLVFSSIFIPQTIMSLFSYEDPSCPIQTYGIVILVKFHILM